MAGIQGILAAGWSRALGLPSWWLPIQALFVPALVFSLGLKLPSVLFLGLFLILWLIYAGNARQRIPLYLTNRATRHALDTLLASRDGPCFLDLGCGLGGTLCYLAKQRPDGEFHGIESAPLPYLISRLRLDGCGNAQVRAGDLWREDLGRYDVVYAFLSPQPMPALWRKAQAEMREGSWLISNTFEIPGVAPSRELHLNDARGTRLLIWEMGKAEPSNLAHSLALHVE